MNEHYSETIAKLIAKHPLGIESNITVQGKVPVSATSEFLTNKEQGDWAEHLVLSSINSASTDYIAVSYGRNEAISAGDPGFAEYYADYQSELNTIGKRPDILIFRKTDIPANGIVDFHDDSLIKKAIVAIEVRSSSFLSEKYAAFMEQRIKDAENACIKLTKEILERPYGDILRNKNKDIYSLLKNACVSTFQNLDFRSSSWHSSPELIFISEHLKKIKENIKLLHRRDFLSITPKLEDLALVNRWIQRYNIPHYYLQVFFDKGYIISFENILKYSSTPALEGEVFSIEQDVKNQGKTTIKINISKAHPLLDKINKPKHCSIVKELDRGRLLFYVKFEGGQGFINSEIFNSLLVQNESI